MGYKVPILPYEEKRHYNRHRPFLMEDGETRKVMTTRYTYEMAVRTSRRKGPLGGKRYERFARYTYYHEGVFYRNANVPTAEGGFVNCLVPISGLVWDAHPKQSVAEGIPVLRIWCDGGVPYRAEHDDFGVVWERADGIGELEGWLGIDKPIRKSPTRAA